MGTKNNPGKFDCYAKAGPDEPMFTLLARDPQAHVLVTAWAVNRAATHGPDDPKSLEALQCANEMLAWRKTRGL